MTDNRTGVNPDYIPDTSCTEDVALARQMQPVQERAYRVANAEELLTAAEAQNALLVTALREIAAVYDDDERGRPAFLSADIEEMADIAKAALVAAGLSIKDAS